MKASKKHSTTATPLVRTAIHKVITMLNNNKCVWDALKDSKEPIILYGMGNGADKVLDEFNKRSIVCHGVMASDDFVRYQNFRGFTVKKMSDFEEELGDFIVALCFASSLPDVMEHIRYVGDAVTTVVSADKDKSLLVRECAKIVAQKSGESACFVVLLDG